MNITRPGSARPVQAGGGSSSTTTAGAVAGQAASTSTSNPTSISTSHEGPQSSNDEPNSGSSMIVIPHPQQTDDFIQLLRTRMGPLWTSRLAMSVGNGVYFEVEDLKIRIGDLVAQGINPAAGAGAGVAVGGAAAAAQQIPRGVIVELAWSGDMVKRRDGSVMERKSKANGAVGREGHTLNGDIQPSTKDHEATRMEIDGSEDKPDGPATSTDQGDDKAQGGKTETEETLKCGEEVLQAFWQRLGVEPGTAYLDWPSSSDLDGAGRMGVARRYCEMLSA